MNKIFFYTLTFFCAVLLFASCKSVNNDKQQGSSVEETIRKERIAHNRRVYDEAAKAQDPYTQLIATYDLMADDSDKDAHYLDTLATLYVKLNMGEPAIKIAKRVLATDPENEKMMELVATGEMSQGNMAESMNIYRKLYGKDKKVKYLFKIASIQLNERNFKDLEQTVKQIDEHPDLASDSLDIPIDANGRMQRVPNKAAIMYLKALIDGEKNNMAGAVNKFQQAVKIYPDFIMAKQYLQAIQAQQTGRR